MAKKARAKGQSVPELLQTLTGWTFHADIGRGKYLPPEGPRVGNTGVELTDRP